MSTSVISVVSHFPDAENGFTTTTAGSVGSGAATVTLNSVAGYTNGEPVVLVIDPTDATKKQTFTGIVDTAGVQVTSVVWTAGTNTTHALGATVVDYATATHIAMMSKGIKVNHTQKGNHKTLTDDNANEWIGLTTTASAVNYFDVANAATATNPILSAKGDDINIGLTLTPKGTGQIRVSGGAGADAWVYNALPAVSSVTANGNRSYNMTFASTVAAICTPGQRFRISRTVAAPTQCTSLNGTTQYYSKAAPNGMTFTDDFVVSAWVKLSSYSATTVTIASRYNGTSGWGLFVVSSGQVQFQGFNAGSANYSLVASYQSIPLNKWVHITAQLDMSAFTATTTTSYVMLDGVDVPSVVARAGTNPVALVQAGNLEIGSTNGGTLPFPGKIAQAAIYSAKVTQATILASIDRTLVGTETSLISAYSFNNSINDLNANANNLTANGSAVATNADSPFALDANGVPGGTYEWGIVTKVATTVATIQSPEGSAIPTTGGVSAVDYSTQKSPYGMPVESGKWRVNYLLRTITATASNATFAAIAGQSFIVPIGAWSVGYQMSMYNSTLTTVNWCLSDTNQTGLALGSQDTSISSNSQSATNAAVTYADAYKTKSAAHTSATTYIMYTLGATTNAGQGGNTTKNEFFAELALL